MLPVLSSYQIKMQLYFLRLPLQTIFNKHDVKSPGR